MPQKNFFHLIALILLTLFLSGCLSKAHLPTPTPGDFQGKIKDFYSNEPLLGASITIDSQTITTTTDGKFLFAQLQPGTHQIMVTHPWYETKTIPLKFVGKTNEYTITLKRLPLNEKLLISKKIDGQWDIFQLDLANQGENQLTDLPSNEKRPQKLRGEQTIIFESDPQGDSDLFLLELPTQSLTKLPCNASKNDQTPSLALNANQEVLLAFKSTRTSPGSILLYNLATREQPPLTITTGSNPKLSPDGRFLAYTNSKYQLQLIDLELSNEPGSPAVPIPFNGKVKNLCWHPDPNERKLAVEAILPEAKRSFIYLVELEPDYTAAWQQVTFPYTKADAHYYPCWSKDGQLIFFEGTIIYKTRKDIYAIRVKDGLKQQEKAKIIMLTKGSGDKRYPSLGEY